MKALLFFLLPILLSLPAKGQVEKTIYLSPLLDRDKDPGHVYMQKGYFTIFIPLTSLKETFLASANKAKTPEDGEKLMLFYEKLVGNALLRQQTKWKLKDWEASGLAKKFPELKQIDVFADFLLAGDASLKRTFDTRHVSTISVTETTKGKWKYIEIQQPGGQSVLSLKRKIERD